MRFGLTLVSRNRKTGPIPVATSSSDTCPSTCALLTKGCYAKTGPIKLAWDRVEKNGMDFKSFLAAVRKLPRRQLWRYGQAGALPASPDDIKALAQANAGRPVLAYTHRRDFDAIKDAATQGFNINLSADSVSEADRLIKTGLPVVTILPSFYQKRPDEDLREYRTRVGGRLRLETPAGNPIAICPATYAETTCALCQACAKPRPGGVIIGFPAHGSNRKHVDARVGGHTVGKVSPTAPTADPRTSRLGLDDCATIASTAQARIDFGNEVPITTEVECC